MAQVLEYLTRQQAQPPAQAPVAPASELNPPLPVVARDVSEPDLDVAEDDQDLISITASWDGSSFPQDEEGQDIQELTFKTGSSSKKLECWAFPSSKLDPGTHGANHQVPPDTLDGSG
ncbi:UNVERIFIED_CONTAM: hypothetical protein FKN15_065201 [Acipenser sinensis]